MDRATFLFPSFINLTENKIFMYVKIWPGEVEYAAPGIPCQCTVAMVDMAYPFVMTVYLSL